MRAPPDVHRTWCVLLLWAAIGLAAAGARATTFVLMDEGALAARSDAAVLGTVLSVHSDLTRGGAVTTTVAIDTEQVVLGSLPSGPVMLHEHGGSVGPRVERIFGSARYEVGEHVLVFVSRDRAGALHTTGMAMGKFRVDADVSGEPRIERSMDDEVLVLDPHTGSALPSRTEAEALATFLRRLGTIHVKSPRQPGTLAAAAASGVQAAPRAAAPFVYLGTPSRWFEPDDGLPVRFLIDATGDAALGADASFNAAVDALATWSGVDGAMLVLNDGVLPAPMPFAGCDGDNRIVFNDPFDEIDAPVGCAGVLGVGGYCTTDGTRPVNDVVFHRIGLGKVVIADGFAACPFWNACNLAEVITHEVGHAIGLGHSKAANATMLAAAHFDGRCAAIADDDSDGVRTMYPFVALATATFTPTSTWTPRKTATPPPRSTPTPWARTATRTPTRTATATQRRTPSRLPTPRTVVPGAVTGRIYYADSAQTVAGVTVDLSGQTLMRATTGTSGRFVFADVGSGRWLLKPRKSGDLGNAVTALDAAWVLQAVAGMRTLTAAQQLACDVTGNGAVSPLDATRILQRRVGAIDRFAAAELCDSDWLFLPAAAPRVDQAVVMPELQPMDCQHGAIVFDPLRGAASGQDFEAALLGDCTTSWDSSSGGNADLAPAPAGTGIAMLPLRRRPGGRWIQPITLRAAGDVHALELDLGFDPSLQFASVHGHRLAEPNVVVARSTQSGRVNIAVASAHPLPSDGGIALLVEFTMAGGVRSRPLIRANAVMIDERRVPTPG